MKKKYFRYIRFFLFLGLVLLSGIILTACSSNTDSYTFNPQLFTKQEQNDEECSLAVGTIEVTFSELNSHDGKIRISGVMNKNCSNLTVSMDEPDIGKNIRIQLAASTTTAIGGTDRPFEVELQANSLRVGSYTIWINGEAMKVFSVE
jgi:hypothetical protein